MYAVIGNLIRSSMRTCRHFGQEAQSTFDIAGNKERKIRKRKKRKKKEEKEEKERKKKGKERKRKRDGL